MNLTVTTVFAVPKPNINPGPGPIGPISLACVTSTVIIGAYTYNTIDAKTLRKDKNI